MIAPLGSWLTTFDAAMTGAMDNGIIGLCAKMFAPMIGAAVIYYILKGIDIANGDETAIDELLPQTVRMGIAIVIASDPAWFNPIVRDFFFQGVPAYLIGGVMQQDGALGAQIGAGINGTAAAFDQVWDQMWVISGQVWGKAGILDVGTRISVIACVMTGALALAAMALVYLASRFILSIVLVLGVIAVALWVVPATRQVFEQWLGKVISLIFLQVALVVTLTIVIAIDQKFVAQMAASGGSASGVATDLEMMVSIVVLFGLGAFAIYSLPAIAYSLGTGIAISTVPALGALYKGLRSGGRALNALPGYPSFPSGPGAGVSLSLNRGALGGGGQTMLPPMPPPALTSSGPLLLR